MIFLISVFFIFPISSQFLEQIQIYPYHGPTSGSTILISLSSIPSESTPLCKFEDQLVAGFNLTSSSFSCSVPSYSSLSLPQDSLILKVSLDGITFSKRSARFYYDKVEISSISPTSGSISGNTEVKISATGLKRYDTLKCRFGAKTAEIIYIDSTSIKCITPSNELGVLSVQISLNGIYYYTAGIYEYRSIELIQTIEPNYGPILGGTKVKLVMSYVHSLYGYCRIGSSVTSSYLENGSIYCITPYSNVSLDISYSSNKQDFESYKEFVYYKEIELKSVSPKFVSRNGSREFVITGGELVNSGMIVVKVIQNEYVSTVPASFQSSIEVRFVLDLNSLSIGIVVLQVSINSQQFSTQTLQIELFIPPTILKLDPNTGLHQGGIPIQILGNFFPNLNPTCLIGSTLSTGKYLSSTLLICKSPTVLSSQILSVSISFNDGLEFTNSLDFTYIETPSSMNISPTSSYNRESVSLTVSYMSSVIPIDLAFSSTIISSIMNRSYSSTVLSIPSMYTGSYNVILYINRYDTVNAGSFRFIGECDIGYTCPLESSFSKVECPVGYYCPSNSLNRPIPCRSGYYANNTKSSTCKLCDSGFYCPTVAMNSPIKCPDGYLCLGSGLGTISTLKVCEAGKTCRNNTTEQCRDKYWCGPRTVFNSYHISNDFRTPQPCRDGIVCLAGLSISPAGTYNCPISYYCKQGTTIVCPVGYYCSYEGLRDPQPCEVGFYNPHTQQIRCTPCSRGKFCPGVMNTSQRVCEAGYVCMHPGRGSSSHICPAGNYCLEGRDSLDIETAQGPKQCRATTFCLIGVKSPEVKSSDVSYAQPCIQGTYCELGTDSPAAKSCPAGFYCPSAVAVPIPAGVGQYAKGLGNPIENPCPPGRYSDTTGLIECKVCPGGYYCSEEGTIIPLICSAGSYRPEDPTYVFCLLCPQGTWSDQPGISSENSCKACEARLVCTEEGLTDLSLADDCPEGYICGEKTTSFSMLNNPCPGGFWCSTRTSLPEHFGVCDPGYYCPEATAISSRYQHLCLQGFYCPPGTNAALNEEGEFSYIKSTDYSYVINAKLLANEACIAAGQVECELYEIPEFEICTEDLEIPEELRKAYTSLQCPNGTSSELGADCLGKCKSLGSAYIYKYINPLINPQRQLQSSSDLTSISIDLDPNTLALLKFDWSSVDIYFKYLSHFSLLLRDSNDNYLTFPEYLTSTDSSSKHTSFTLSILNYSSEKTSFTLDLALHNSIFELFSYQLENTLNLTVHEPSRASLGSDDMFVIILAESDFTDLDLPYNLIDLNLDDSSSRSPMLINIGSNEEFYGTQFDAAPWDETFWVIYQVNTVAMSWLPFFMNCEEFGNNVYFYRLVELMESCKLVTESDTMEVDPIPITGWFPTADECELLFKCYYSEDITVKRTKSGSWYDIEEEKVLFYMTKEPYSRTVFFEARAGTDLDSIFTEDVKDLSDNIIAVSFIPDSSSIGGVPTTVEVNIRYYQKTPTQKKLITVEVLLKDYSLEEVNAEFPGYTLKVSYKALGWFDLLNSFELGIPVYILIFIILVIIILSIIIAFYFLHLLVFKFKDPPAMHLRMYLASSAIPPALGTMYGSIPIFVVMFILVAVRDGEILPTLAGDWKDMTTPDTDQILVNTRGRLGMILFIIGVAFLVVGGKLLIPIPRKSEETQDEGTSIVDGSLTNIQDDTIKHHSKQPSEDLTKEALSSDRKTSFDSFPESIQHSDHSSDEDYLTVLKYKKRYFLIVSVFLALITTFKMELSYSKVFTDNILVFLFFFQVSDIMINILLSRFILNEALLVSPFLASLALNEIIMTIAADTFTSFIQCYLFWLGILIFQRLYMMPFIEYLETKLQQFAIYLMKRFVLAERLFKHTILNQLEMKRSLLANFSRVGGSEGKNMEGLLITMVNYSSSIQAVFMAPFVLVFILYFADETQIPKNYKIQQQDVAYYLLFNVLIIIPQLLVDIMVFHLLESIYDYKIFDYFTYCSYRFRTRRQPWIFEANEKLDRSLLMPWRSIDKMSYSSQYYFSVTLASWGIMCLTIGWTILLRNNFNPFGDPSFFILLILIIITGIPFKIVIQKIAHAFRVWTPNTHSVFIQEIPEEEEPIVQLIDEYAEENALLVKIQTALFKSKFLQKNRIWLIENVDSIARENFTSHEQLKQVYQQIMNYHAHQEKSQRHIEEIQDKFLALPHYRDRQELDISQEDTEIKSFKLHPEPDPSSIRLALHWLNSARLIQSLKKAVIALHEIEIGNTCSKCESRDRLRLVTMHSLYEILDRFREEYKGYVITLNKWKKYYSLHQQYFTYCIDCAYIAQLANKQDLKTAGSLTKIAFQSLQSIKPRTKQIGSNSTLRKIAVRWLIEARSNLRKISREQTEMYNSVKSLSFSSLSMSFAVSEVEDASVDID